MKIKNLDFNFLVSCLDENYVNEEINGFKLYYYTDKKKRRITNRIVAIKSSDNCIGLCINSYGKKNFFEEKMSFSIFNYYNPLFLILGDDKDEIELIRGINSLVNLLKIGGDLSAISIGKNKLSVAQLNYEKKYKLDNNPLYNKIDHVHNIKAIGDITRDVNNVRIRFEKMNIDLEEQFDHIRATGNHNEFKKYVYEDSITSDLNDNKTLKKTI